MAKAVLSRTERAWSECAMSEEEKTQDGRRGHTRREATEGRALGQREGCTRGRQDGAEGDRIEHLHEWGVQIHGLLHGESSGQSVETTIHGGLGIVGHSEETRGALLCIQTLVPQAHPHLDQHAGMGAERDNRDRTVRDEMRNGVEDRVWEVGSQVQVGTRQSLGERRARQEGEEEYDAEGATQRAAAGGYQTDTDKLKKLSEDVS